MVRNLIKILSVAEEARKEAASWISPVLFQIPEIWGIEDGLQASDHL